MRIYKKLIWCCLIVLVLLIWLGLANPFNWFVRSSPNFSLRDFRAIQKGSHIEAAIARLGAPIAVVRGGPALGCPGCSAYYFLGDPPPWLLYFKEAWLLVDRQGRVVAVIVNSEP